MGFKMVGCFKIIVLLFSVTDGCIEEGKEIKNEDKLIVSKFNSKKGCFYR